jgi:pimeloyl-ACP methyl ester carboxylesterase
MKRVIFMFVGLMIVLLAACAPATETPVSPPETAVPEPVETAVPQPIQEEAAETIATAVPTPIPEQPTAEPSPEPVEETPETAVLGPVIREEVTIAAEDGLALQAAFYAAGGLQNAPGVLLLHMLGSSRQAWDDVGLAEALAEAGYAVLALDMRGHGATGGGKNWDAAEDDHQRVWDYFVGRDEVDGAQTAVIGASIGSNMALIAAANEPAIRTAVLLSPGLDYRGVTTEDRLADYGERPLLIVASEEDGYAANSSRTLAETAVGETKLELYNGAGHGTNMFAAKPELTSLILEWLAQHLDR